MMYNMVLKAKLHLATVTHAELHYDGSCAIDANWLEMTGLGEYEQIQIYNRDNGERLTTYIIKADAGSGIISLNGAAARKAAIGDRVIICAYALMDQKETSACRPAMIYLDGNNNITRKVNVVNNKDLKV